MKKVLKIILIITGVCAMILLFIYCAVVYVFNYAVGTADQSESPDGKYTLLLQSVGSPVFFSSADGRLVLKEGGKKICQCDFVLSDDGGSIRPDIWQVTWEDQQVTVIVSGSEQSDERITISFAGEINKENVSNEGSTEDDRHSDAYGGGGRSGEADDSSGSAWDGSEDYYQKIKEGYMGIYDQIFQKQGDSCFEEYDARGNLRLVLHEDDRTVEYLMYDRESANGKCGLYVYYSSQKQEDGSWSPNDAQILDMYAWVYDTGEVISSEKTGWADTGTEEYREATGE